LIKTIDRYIFRELLEPFLFGLGAFTAILSASMVLFELVRAVVLRGMPLLVALQIFIYRLPGIAVYIFPMATLLAALLAFSRLSHDLEVTAFKASGVSLFRLILPVIAFGLLVSLVNLSFSEVVVPEANRAAKNLLLATAVKQPPKIQKNVFVPEVEQGVLKRIYYAQAIKGSVMRGVIVQEFAEGRLAQIINAEEALWQQNKNQWLFRNGTIYLIAESGEYKHLVKFKEQYLTLKYTPADFYTEEKNPDEMNLRQLRHYIAEKERMGVEVTDLKIQLNMKMAIPFASLVFAFLGAPLGLSPRRTSGSVGLGISIIVIFFYYLIAFFSLALGEMQLFTPGLAAWMPNLVTAAVGLYILKEAAEK